MINHIGKHIVHLPDDAVKATARRGETWIQVVDAEKGEFALPHGIKIWRDTNKYLPKSLEGKVYSKYKVVKWL